MVVFYAMAELKKKKKTGKEHRSREHDRNTILKYLLRDIGGAQTFLVYFPVVATGTKARWCLGAFLSEWGREGEERC